MSWEGLQQENIYSIIRNIQPDYFTFCTSVLDHSATPMALLIRALLKPRRASFYDKKRIKYVVCLYRTIVCYKHTKGLA